MSWEALRVVFNVLGAAAARLDEDDGFLAPHPARNARALQVQIGFYSDLVSPAMILKSPK